MTENEQVFSIDRLQVLALQKPLFPAVSLQLAAGELVTVMGPSGCGKSMLLSSIAGSLAPELTVNGSIYLHAKKLNDIPIHRREIAIAYQDDLLFPHLDVAGNLLFALAKGSKLKRMSIVKETLKSTGLEGFENRDVATLSGGQRARISLLRTLLAKPKLLLLDEPFSKLDEQLRQSFREFVYQQIKNMDIPAILVTHDKQDCQGSEFYALQKGLFEKK